MQKQIRLIRRAGGQKFIPALALSLTLLANSGHSSVVGFEDLTLTSQSYWNGSSGAGSFTSGGVTFPNSYNSSWGSWSGFAYSNVQNSTTPGWGNQYAAWPGGGAEGSLNYVVGYQPSSAPWAISLAGSRNFHGRGLLVANTTYTALDMREGSGFSKKFGGISGHDPDWLRLTIRGRLGGTETGAVDFYLADYRFADSTQDTIVNSWAFVDLTSLGTVDELRFALDSSDHGAWGMNTPAYFAMDNLGAVPEPSAASLVFTAALVLTAVRKYRRVVRS